MTDVLLWIGVLALAVAGTWENLTVIQIRRERRKT
jgi:hypothetical protein